MPDPKEMQFRSTAEDDQTPDGAQQIEEAAQDEVLDIVTAKGPQDGDAALAAGEPRSFTGNDSPSDAKDPAADEKTAKAGVKDADSQPDEADAHVDKQLDHGLKETFPASDPVSINPGAD
jgi:hypothetical protein